MKIIDIALKDLLRSLRSMFLVGMAFIAPLVMSFIFSTAFGGSGDISLAAIDLSIVNLDQGGGIYRMADSVVELLMQEDFSDLFSASSYPDEASALQAIADRDVQVAVIIPADFSAAVADPSIDTTIRVLHDPTLNLMPGIIESIVQQIADSFSGTKIAIQLALEEFSRRGVMPQEDAITGVVSQYTNWASSQAGFEEDGSSSALNILPPAPQTGAQKTLVQQIVAGVMASMMIFFVFFTGAYGAESILDEHEKGTLARAFQSPTPLGQILGGKFLGIIITVILQVTVLVISSALIFKIDWGAPLPLIMAGFALVVAASGLGIFLMSIIKSTRQTGIIMGGVMTVMGMLGGLFIGGVENMPRFLEIAKYLTPQGWCSDAWQTALSGGTLLEVLYPSAVAVAIGIALFALGVFFFRRRFAD